MRFSELISGSDIRGTAVGSIEEVNLTPAAAEALSCGFVRFLRGLSGNAGRLRIAVGHDSRISADDLKQGVINGLKALDTEILDCGLTSTPSMFMMTKFEESKADGAIMITASHHPYNKNGLKFFTPAGGLEHSDIETLAGYAEEYDFDAKKPQNYKLVKRDFPALYCNHLIGIVRKATGSDVPLAGLKVVVDAGNGAGGFYAERILRPLGADTGGSQFLNPDGLFPNHVPNPEDKTAMRSISERVLKTGADFGIIFDTDVDRSAVVDSAGREYNRNKLIALISAILLKERSGATIVTDSITSDSLTEFIQKAGGRHHRFKRGYRNVINEAVRLNNEGVYTPVAIETSGHCALMENYFLDDGAYLATRLIIELAKLRKEGKTLDSLIEGLKEPEDTVEFRIGFKTADFKEYGGRVIKELKAKLAEKFRVAPQNYEGVRANFDTGWLLVRMSVHDPNMPVNIESDIKGGAKQAARDLFELLKVYDGLDLAALEKYIG